MSRGWYGVGAEMALHAFLILFAMLDAQVIAGRMHRRHQEENFPSEGLQEEVNSPGLYSAQPQGRSHLQPRMSLVELKQVHKHYYLGETRIAALQGIDLTIRKGEFVAIWGPSGSGKSTLCNLIGMLDSPTAGAVLLKGHDVTHLPDDKRSELRNTTIGFIFQSFNLLPVLSAVENVMLPLQVQGYKTRAAKAKAMQRLTDVGLSEYIAQRPQKLSGGQQQRVAIARALIADPALVLADEPTANLDSETALKIIDLMRQLNRQSGTTFIFSTHDRRLLERVDRQILLRDGTIAEDRTVTMA